MRKVVLYIAMSLDGYIADAKNGVSWLVGDGSEPNSQGSYLTFYETIDTIILGWNTYNQITKELSPDNWPYKDKKSYIFTHQKINNLPNIEFKSTSIDKFINETKQIPGKNIWICGGANIVDQLLKKNLIDIFQIAIIPTVLGNGIKLFDNLDQKIRLNFKNAISYNGIVEIIYERKL